MIAQEHHAIWNGVTVSPEGRIFVNYPTLSPKPILVVGEVEADGTVRPYPGREWNQWVPGKAVAHALVDTNAVRVGPDGNLGVVTGSQSFGAETLPGARMIVCIDLRQNVVRRIYPLGPELSALPLHWYKT